MIEIIILIPIQPLSLDKKRIEYIESGGTRNTV
jgi:hypothetical protein